MNQPSCKLKGELIEKLVSSYDCKQGAIRVVRFNGLYNMYFQTIIIHQLVIYAI